MFVSGRFSAGITHLPPCRIIAATFVPLQSISLFESIRVHDDPADDEDWYDDDDDAERRFHSVPGVRRTDPRNRRPVPCLRLLALASRPAFVKPPRSHARMGQVHRLRTSGGYAGRTGNLPALTIATLARITRNRPQFALSTALPRTDPPLQPSSAGPFEHLASWAGSEASKATPVAGCVATAETPAKSAD